MQSISLQLSLFDSALQGGKSPASLIACTGLSTTRLPVATQKGSCNVIYARGLFYNGATKDQSSRNSKLVLNRNVVNVESFFAGPHYRTV